MSRTLGLKSGLDICENILSFYVNCRNGLLNSSLLSIYPECINYVNDLNIKLKLENDAEIMLTNNSARISTRQRKGKKVINTFSINQYTEAFHEQHLGFLTLTIPG